MNGCIDMMCSIPWEGGVSDFWFVVLGAMVGAVIIAEIKK